MHAIISFFSKSLDLKSVTSPLLFKLVSSNVASDEKLAEKI